MKQETKLRIYHIVTGPEGFAVDLFGGTLHISRLEGGLYAVQGPSLEKFFHDPEEAVDFFLVKREELKLGYDFEKQKPTNA